MARWIWAGAMLAIVLGYAVAGKAPIGFKGPFGPSRHVRRDTEPVRFSAIICAALFVTVYVWASATN